MSKKRKGAKQAGSDRAVQVLGVLIGGAMIVLTFVGVVWAVRYGVSASRVSDAFTRLNQTIDKFNDPTHDTQVSRLDPKYGGLYGGLPKDSVITIDNKFPMNAAAREIAKEIEFLPEYCRKQAAEESIRSSTRLATIGALIPKFPQDAPLEPLMRLPPGNSAYDAAIKLVRERAGHALLIEKSCSDDEGVRSFSARVLGLSMPYGKLQEAGVLELAAKTSVVEKQNAYERLYGTAHQAIESQLVGQYRLKMDAVWKTAEGTESPFGLTTEQPVVDVSCVQRNWTFKLLDQVWTGQIDDLSAARLNSRLTKAVEKLSKFPGMQSGTQLNLSCSESGLSISLSPVAIYIPMREIEVKNPRVPRIQPAKEGYSSFSTSLVQ